MFHLQGLPGEPRQAHVAGNDFLGWHFMQEHRVVKLNKIVFPHPLPHRLHLGQEVSQGLRGLFPHDGAAASHSQSPHWLQGRLDVAIAVWNVVCSYWLALVPDPLVKCVVLLLDFLLVFGVGALDADNRTRLFLWKEHCSQAVPSFFPSPVVLSAELQVILVARLWDVLQRSLADLPERPEPAEGSRLEVVVLQGHPRRRRGRAAAGLQLLHGEAAPGQGEREQQQQQQGGR